MKFVVALHDFVNAPKIWCLVTFVYVICKPSYTGCDGKGTESEARTQDRL